MKKLVIIVLSVIFATSIFAQDDKSEQEYKTLFGGERTTHGGYGGLSINYSQIDGKDAMLIGARGGWIINHGISIGIGGYGFANDMNYEKNINGIIDNYSLAGGYGGLIIEPIIGAKWPLHVSIPILIGAGGVALINNNYYKPNYDWDSHYYSDEADAFFVIEPGIEVELNMVKFMRLAVGGYYRYTSDLNLADTKSDVLDGFSVGLTMKFGKF